MIAILIEKMVLITLKVGNQLTACLILIPYKKITTACVYKVR